MKKILFLGFILLTQNCFAHNQIFNPNLPQQIICQGNKECFNSGQYNISGWTFSTQYNSGYIKSGTYNFIGARLVGDPNDDFIKQVTFLYSMIDDNGYSYALSYTTINWVLPIYSDNYRKIINEQASVCQSANVKNCYVNLLKPTSSN